MLRNLSPVTEEDYNVISLDVESDERANPYVFCVYGFYNGKEIKRTFYNKTEVVKFLFRRKWYRTILTGVNIGFDLNFLKYHKGYNWDEIYNMGRLITASPKENSKEYKEIYKCKRHNYLKIIDLSNWILNTSLETMAKKFNIQGHIDKHILDKDGDIKEMSEACMSHARTGVLVFQILQRIIHKMGGHIKVTGSATALDLFRRKYLKHEYNIYDFIGESEHRFKGWMHEGETPEKGRERKLEYMKEIGRLAYVGGRCENFKLGLFNDVDYLDINSSYPFQMYVRKFPDMNTYSRRTGDLTALKGYLQDYEGEAHIKVKSPKNLLIPFLHYRNEEGKLIFPLGEFSGWYTFPEIRKALEIGYKITEIKEIAVFDRIDSPFRFYIEDMMVYKKRGDTKEAAKLLMNGLSGKMGQLKPEPDGWELIEEAGNYEVDNKKYFCLNGQIWKYEKPEHFDEESKFVKTAYPLLIAYITAYGRIQEYEAIEAIGQDKVYYMDTDSIIADHTAVQKAIKTGAIKIDDNELGAYKIEHERATVEIRGLKYYRIHDNPLKFNDDFKSFWTYHIKGVPKKLMPFYWIHRKGAFSRPVKMKTALRKKEDDPDKKVNLFIRQFHSDKIKADNKRKFTGKHSLPFEVNE